MTRKRAHSFDLEGTPVWVSLAAISPARASNPLGPPRLSVAFGGKPALRVSTEYGRSFAAAAAHAQRLLGAGGAGGVELTGLRLSCSPLGLGSAFNPVVRVATFADDSKGPCHFSSNDFMRLTGPVMDYDRAVPQASPLDFPLPSLAARGNVLVTVCTLGTAAWPLLSRPHASPLVRFWVNTNDLKGAKDGASLVRALARTSGALLAFMVRAYASRFASSRRPMGVQVLGRGDLDVAFRAARLLPADFAITLSYKAAGGAAMVAAAEAERETVVGEEEKEEGGEGSDVEDWEGEVSDTHADTHAAAPGSSRALTKSTVFPPPRPLSKSTSRLESALGGGDASSPSQSSVDSRARDKDHDSDKDDVLGDLLPLRGGLGKGLGKAMGSMSDLGAGLTDGLGAGFGAGMSGMSGMASGLGSGLGEGIGKGLSFFATPEAQVHPEASPGAGQEKEQAPRKGTSI
jgi:hypothetical protein